MNKEEAIIEFLKGLRIVFNNASAYPKDHPYFIKSVETFKEKLGVVFTFLNPIKINVGPNLLNVDGKNYEKSTLYVDLANLFHFRKIKNIQIMAGVSTKELVDLLSNISLPIREILRQGGLKNLIDKERDSHISFEELDYSQLLGDEGEESKDVWVYLFKEAATRQDSRQINELTDNFAKIIRKFKISDLLEDEEIKNNIDKFLLYLKEQEREKFIFCVKELFTNISKYKEVLKEDNIEKIKIYFRHLNDEDFADILWDQILTNDNFDTFTFLLFSKLVGEKRKDGISASLLKKLSHRENLIANPKAVKKIKDLFSLSRQDVTSDVYQHILNSLFNNITFDNILAFDRNLLRINYRFLLINLLAIVKNKEILNSVIEKLYQEVETAINEKDFKSIRALLEILRSREKEDPSLGSLLGGLEKLTLKFIESSVCAEEFPEDAADLVDSIRETSVNAKFYLDRIFLENTINPYILKLFFKFFPLESQLFYKALGHKASDVEFLDKVITSSKGLNNILSIEILEKIFSSGSQFIKIQVLKAMQGLSKIDEVFLFPILQKRDIALKKEALSLLAKDDQLAGRAIKVLLDIPSFLGFKNNIILENISIIEELDLRGARDKLLYISKRGFFWNSALRDKAREILGKWNVRTD